MKVQMTNRNKPRSIACRQQAVDRGSMRQLSSSEAGGNTGVHLSAKELLADSGIEIPPE